jgi:hypothetical protein
MCKHRLNFKMFFLQQLPMEVTKIVFPLFLSHFSMELPLILYIPIVNKQSHSVCLCNVLAQGPDNFNAFSIQCLSYFKRLVHSKGRIHFQACLNCTPALN